MCCQKHLMNSNMRLRWHQSNESEFTEVEAWIKVGEIIPSTVIQPKLQWSEVSNRNVHGFKTNLLRGHVDLLDIFKVVEVSYDVVTDSKLKFPFARKHLSFVIQTTDDKEILFEARNTKERDLFVFSLKAVVATLTSRLLLDEKSAYRDFFSRRSKYIQA